MNRPIPLVELKHAGVTGRIRLGVSLLYRDPALARAVEGALRDLTGIHRVSASPLTATVLLIVDPTLSNEDIDALMRRVSAVVASAVGAPPAPVSVQPAAKPVERGLADYGWLEALRTGTTHTRRRLRGELKHEVAAASSDAPTETVAAEPWHVMAADDVLALWACDERGLSRAVVEERLTRFGPNRLIPPQRRSELAIFLGQLKSVPVAMLAGSALLSVATGGIADAGAILVVLGLNATIGYVTESGAERTISSLEQGGPWRAKLQREGISVELDVADIVPGDLLVLEPGARIGADARIVHCVELNVDESSLTGESVPVNKSATELADVRAPLADRVDMVFRGTIVTGGSGLAVVVATGRSTEIGRVQELAGSVERPETPLERQLSRLGTELAIAAAAVCGGVFAIGMLRGRGWLEMLKTSISLAVAAVPEGLPTVAITTLALGIRRMRELNVLVRQLEAVETLGGVQIFCLDKTGTITENRMSVVEAFAADHKFEVTSDRFVEKPEPDAVLSDPSLRRLLEIVVLSSEAQIVEAAGAVSVQGSPTETALVRLAIANGVDVRQLRQNLPNLRTRYRSQTRAWMDTLHRTGDGYLVAVKGRPTDLLPLCDHVLIGETLQPLEASDRADIERQNERMAGGALRVLGVAYQKLALPDDEMPRLVWVGLVGLIDPPRPGLSELFRRFHDAGIDTVMVTGDQSATAHAVARRIGLGRNGRIDILDSTRLEELPPELLASLAGNVQVFARVSPAHKLGIVQALQRSGRVVAMTGDGVNDGPALKAADVGVAMGAQGTAVARELADVVLEKDELSTMLVAVQQGRTIYDDIKKAVHFILATNSSEILLTFLQVASGLGQTLTPMQLLWINILTDVFPELALAVEPSESDVMSRPPREPGRPMFERKDLARIGVEGIALTSGALAAYGWGRARYGPGPHANTLTFFALTSAQLLHALSARSERHSLFDRGNLKRNAYIPLAVGGSLALQCLASLLPAGRRWLGTTPLGFADWIAAAACATGPLLFNEGVKVLLRKDRSAYFVASPHSGIVGTAAEPVYEQLPATPPPRELPPKPGANGFDSHTTIEE